MTETDDSWLDPPDDAPAADPLVMGKRDLAAATGIAPKELEKHIAAGLPTHGARRKGVSLAFRLPDVIQWLLARNGGDGFDAAKRRNLEATARKREVEASRMEGRYVALDFVEGVIRDQVAKLQSELLAIPARLPADVRELAQAEISGAINRLAFAGIGDE